MVNLIAASQHGSGKLAFGVLKNDGFVTPHPPVQRAIGTYTNQHFLPFAAKFGYHEHGITGERCFSSFMHSILGYVQNPS